VHDEICFHVMHWSKSQASEHASVIGSRDESADQSALGAGD